MQFNGTTLTIEEALSMCTMYEIPILVLIDDIEESQDDSAIANVSPSIFDCHPNILTCHFDAHLAFHKLSLHCLLTCFDVYPITGDVSDTSLGQYETEV
jgi:hypothetical protein